MRTDGKTVSPDRGRIPGILAGGGLALVGWFLLVRQQPGGLLFSLAALLLLLVALFMPGLLAIPGNALIRLSAMVSLLLVRLLLYVVYFFLLLPAGLLFILSGHGICSGRRQPRQASFWRQAPDSCWTFIESTSEQTMRW